MENRREKRSLSSVLKNLFWILVILQFAPMVLMNLKKTTEDLLVTKEQVGMLKITGMISNADFYNKKIRKFAKDPEVKGLFLSIDTPGGYPGAAQSLYQEVNRFKEKKPVVAVVQNMATSAGFYVACAANKIITTPGALVGNIGSMMQVPDVKALMNELKVDMHHVHSGKFKAAGSPARATTPEELAYFQELSDDTYRQFVQDVAKSRDLDPEDHARWADGKALTGKQALKLGLVDQLGNYHDGVEAIKKLAKIEGEVKFIKVKKRPSLLNMIMGKEDLDVGEFSFSDAIARCAFQVYQKFCTLQASEQLPRVQ